jgi:hypothetical protein
LAGKVAPSFEFLLAAGEAGGGRLSSSATVRPVWLLASLVVVQAGVCFPVHRLQFAAVASGVR